MRKLLFTIYILLTSGGILAQDLKSCADSIYMQEKYDAAIALYDSLLAANGASAEVYYNLGNCHYKFENMALAVLNYERALLINPGDEDIRFNLELARSKTIDRITPHHEIFLVTWWRSFVNLTGSDTWAVVAAMFFVLMLLLVFVFLFAPYLMLQKLCFYSAIPCLIVCLAANVCAWQQSQRQEYRTGAVVMEAAAIVRSTPAKNGTDLFVLHEGTRVDITDDTMREWKEIVLADGKRGWIEAKQIERI